ncbi:MAG: MFS transporter [Thermoleophilaceae bacterium]|nr:MFS transporter [Thermoleophilaceae bacterium]
MGLPRASALAIVVGAFCVLPGFLVGVLALQISRDLGVSVVGAASGVTAFFAAGALGAGVLGRLSQRIGALTAMRGASLVSGTCLLGIAAFASSLPVLFGLLALAGLANSAAQPAINLFMAEEVPRERQGLGFGLKQSAVPAAILLSGLALPALALPFGWRTAVAVCGVVALAVGASAGRRRTSEPVEASARHAGPRPSAALVLLAVGGGLASFGPNALGAYIVASAVDVGVAEGAAGILVAVGSGLSFAARVALGARADRRADYGLTTVALLLAGGSAGFLLMASHAAGPFVVGALFAFTVGWAWPGLYNLAVVERNRGTPAAATGVTQTGIYVGAAAGPVTFGLLSAEAGYPAAWAVIAGTLLLAAAAIAAGERLNVRESSRAAQA